MEEAGEFVEVGAPRPARVFEALSELRPIHIALHFNDYDGARSV
jgi:hypothetical protein